MSYLYCFDMRYLVKSFNFTNKRGIYKKEIDVKFLKTALKAAIDSLKYHKREKS